MKTIPLAPFMQVVGHAKHGAAPSGRASCPMIMSADDFIRSADKAFEYQNLREARQHLRAALALQPEDSRLLLALGHVEFGLGLHEMAQQRYQAVCEMNPKLADGPASLSLVLYLTHQLRQAEAAALQAITLHSQNLIALKVLARIALDTGRHDRAWTWCRRILQFQPADPEAIQLLDECRFDLEFFQNEPPIPYEVPSAASKIAKFPLPPGSNVQRSAERPNPENFVRGR